MASSQTAAIRCGILSVGHDEPLRAELMAFVKSIKEDKAAAGDRRRRVSPAWRLRSSVSTSRSDRDDGEAAAGTLVAGARSSQWRAHSALAQTMNQHARVDLAPIPFIDVAAQRRRLGDAIDAAVARVLEHCQFILGPEVRALEAALADFCGARHAVTCASGTDALIMVLMAQGIGPGDAVICPSFTFCATAEAVVLVGATPVFADVDAVTFNMRSGERRSARSRRPAAPASSRKMVIPVDLFGLPADYDAINEFAAAENLFVLADAAQGFGGEVGNRKVGTLADATATSFFPAKPLGCYGDGGAVFTDDDHMRDVLAQPARARAGHRPIRPCADRSHRAAGYDPGGGADRKTENLPRRDRTTQSHCGPLFGRARGPL